MLHGVMLATSGSRGDLGNVVDTAAKADMQLLFEHVKIVSVLEGSFLPQACDLRSSVFL